MATPEDEGYRPEDNGTIEGRAIVDGGEAPAPMAGPAGTVDDTGPRLRRMTRRGFAWGGAAALAGLTGWRWVATRSEEDGLPWPLRRVLELE